jgi:hypothetical protein
MDTQQTRVANLRHLIETEFDGVDARLAERVGRQPSYIYRIFTDKEQHRRPLGEKLARDIERACGKPLGWLDIPQMRYSDTDTTSVADQSPYSPITAMSHRAAYLIPIYGDEGSMGHGKEAPREESTVVGGLQISKEWVRRNLPDITAPTNLAVITGLGDSMTPTFNDGDILLVDRGITSIKLDAVYVLEREGEIFVKRLQRRLNGDLVIQSDNQVLRPDVVANGDLGAVSIKGRVVYAWNGKRL